MTIFNIVGSSGVSTVLLQEPVSNVIRLRAMRKRPTNVNAQRDVISPQLPWEITRQK